MAGLRPVLSGAFWLVLGWVLPKNRIGDGVYSAIRYLRVHGRLPRFCRPLTHNDHLFRRKWSGLLYDPLYQFTTDKILVKDYIAGILGPDYVVPTLDVLDTAEAVDRYRPSQFPCVIKPSHMSGIAVLLSDPDQSWDRAVMKQCLTHNFYHCSREANYRYLRPRIMVEGYCCGEDGLTEEYKAYCYGGRPKFVMAISDRFGVTKSTWYSPSWAALPFRIGDHPVGSVPRPACLDELLEISARIAPAFGNFVRIDFLADGGRLKIGELTHLPSNCLGPLSPSPFDRRIGALHDNPDLEVEQVLAL